VRRNKFLIPKIGRRRRLVAVKSGNPAEGKIRGSISLQCLGMLGKGPRREKICRRATWARPGATLTSHELCNGLGLAAYQRSSTSAAMAILRSVVLLSVSGLCALERAWPAGNIWRRQDKD
jgi:hypothetical protein